MTTTTALQTAQMLSPGANLQAYTHSVNTIRFYLLSKSVI